MLTLSSSEMVLLIIIGLSFALIISNRVRPDLVALLVLLALGLSRIVTPAQALGGFSSSAVITIVGLFVVSSALERTGVVQWMADQLTRLSGTDERQMLLVFMLAGALLSLAMNNIAAGAVLLPAAVRVGRQANVRPSRLLMPLGFGTLLGGMATLFTTANIIISGALQAQGQRGLTLGDFLPSGGVMVLAGVLYMLFVGRRLLPNRETATSTALPRADLTKTYQLAERLWEVRVQPDSPLVRRRLADSVIGAQLGVTVLGIWHGQEAKIAPAPSEVIAANDILLVLGREERVRQLEREHVTIGRDGQSAADVNRLTVNLTEVVIGPRSSAIGQTLKDLRFRTKFGLTTVALWREGRSYRTDVGNFALQAGDALLMVGPPERVRQLAQEPGYIVLGQPAAASEATGRGLWAALITLVVLGLSAAGIVPTAEAVLAGTAALVLTGCLSMDDAYRAVEWRVVVLIAGMLPIGAALVGTGLAGEIGRLFTAALAPAGPLALVVGLYLFTLLITQFVGGQVAALIVGPIAVSAAMRLGVNPAAVGVAVSMACSAAFLTPVAHPVNVLMMGPGGYTFADFPRVGLGLALVCTLMLPVVMLLFWRL